MLAGLCCRLQGLSMLIATLEQPNGVLASPIQADLGYVLRQLLGVLPALAVPCIATTLGASAVVSEPVSLGITSAAAALLGAGHLVGVILSGGGPLGLMMTIVWACGGALVALLAMKNIVGPGSSSQGQEVRVCRWIQAKGHCGLWVYSSFLRSTCSCSQVRILHAFATYR
jgi:hypothetical protein